VIFQFPLKCVPVSNGAQVQRQIVPRLGAATLKARSPNFRHVLGTCRSDFVADRKKMWRSGSAETDWSRFDMYNQCYLWLIELTNIVCTEYGLQRMFNCCIHIGLIDFSHVKNFFRNIMLKTTWLYDVRLQNYGVINFVPFWTTLHVYCCMWDINTFEYLLFYHVMSAIDTYKKYNLHSAAPYIGGMSGSAKKQGETSGGRCPRAENVLHPYGNGRHCCIKARSACYSKT